MIDWAGITFNEILTHFGLTAALGWSCGFGLLWFRRLLESSVS